MTSTFVGFVVGKSTTGTFSGAFICLIIHECATVLPGPWSVRAYITLFVTLDSLGRIVKLVIMGSCSLVSVSLSLGYLI